MELYTKKSFKIFKILVVEKKNLVVEKKILVVEKTFKVFVEKKIF